MLNPVSAEEVRALGASDALGVFYTDLFAPVNNLRPMGFEVNARNLTHIVRRFYNHYANPIGSGSTRGLYIQLQESGGPQVVHSLVGIDVLLDENQAPAFHSFPFKDTDVLFVNLAFTFKKLYTIDGLESDVSRGIYHHEKKPLTRRTTDAFVTELTEGTVKVIAHSLPLVDGSRASAQIDNLDTLQKFDREWLKRSRFGDAPDSGYIRINQTKLLEENLLNDKIASTFHRNILSQGYAPTEHGANVNTRLLGISGMGAFTDVVPLVRKSADDTFTAFPEVELNVALLRVDDLDTVVFPDNEKTDKAWDGFQEGLNKYLDEITVERSLGALPFFTYQGDEIIDDPETDEELFVKSSEPATATVEVFQYLLQRDQDNKTNDNWKRGIASAGSRLNPEDNTELNSLHYAATEAQEVQEGIDRVYQLIPAGEEEAQKKRAEEEEEARRKVAEEALKKRAEEEEGDRRKAAEEEEKVRKKRAEEAEEAEKKREEEEDRKRKEAKRKRDREGKANTERVLKIIQRQIEISTSIKEISEQLISAINNEDSKESIEAKWTSLKTHVDAYRKKAEERKSIKGLKEILSLREVEPSEIVRSRIFEESVKLRKTALAAYKKWKKEQASVVKTKAKAEEEAAAKKKGKAEAEEEARKQQEARLRKLKERLDQGIASATNILQKARALFDAVNTDALDISAKLSAVYKAIRSWNQQKLNPDEKIEGSKEFPELYKTRYEIAVSAQTSSNQAEAAAIQRLEERKRAAEALVQRPVDPPGDGVDAAAPAPVKPATPGAARVLVSTTDRAKKPTRSVKRVSQPVQRLRVDVDRDLARAPLSKYGQRAVAESVFVEITHGGETTGRLMANQVYARTITYGQVERGFSSVFPLWMRDGVLVGGTGPAQVVGKVRNKLHVWKRSAFRVGYKVAGRAGGVQTIQLNVDIPRMVDTRQTSQLLYTLGERPRQQIVGLGFDATPKRDLFVFKYLFISNI